MVASAPCFGQTLWRSAQIGMSVEQAREAVPSAESYEPAANQRLPNGAIPLLKLPPEEIAGVQFAPTFYFLDGKLVQINLKAETQFEESIAAFHRLRDALRAKYGPEVANTVMKPSAEPFGTMKWSAGRTTVALTVFSFSLLNKASILVSYSGTLAAIGDKL